MAPIIGLNRKQLLELLERPGIRHTLPIQLNWMGPAGVVVLEGDQWRLRAMACNHELAECEHQERIAAGEDRWQPEDTWPFYEPAEILLEASTKDEFITAIRAMDWPFTPDDFDQDESTQAMRRPPVSITPKK